MLWFSKKIGGFQKNLECPGIFREIEGITQVSRASDLTDLHVCVGSYIDVARQEGACRIRA